MRYPLLFASLLCAGLTVFSTNVQAQIMSGHPCTAIGTSQRSDDDTTIVACLKTSTTNPALIWKSMTPVHIDTAGCAGVATTTPAA